MGYSAAYVPVAGGVFMKWIRNFKWIFVFYGIVFLLLGSMNFWGGFHNIDMSRNFLMMAYMEGLDYHTWADKSMGGNIVGFDEGYRNGLTMTIIGYYTSLAGIAMLCLGLSIKSK